MENTMMRLTLLLFIVLLSGGYRLAAQEAVIGTYPSNLHGLRRPGFEGMTATHYVASTDVPKSAIIATGSTGAIGRHYSSSFTY
jgi:hypothetical protein